MTPYHALYLGLVLTFTLFSGIFFYILAVTHSWSVYFQNLSLVPIGYRLLVLIGGWVIITLPFLLIFKRFRLGFGCLMGFILFNVFLDAYYVGQILSVSHHFSLSKQLLMARYGEYHPIKMALSESIRLKHPDIEGSPDGRFWVEFNDKSHKFELYDAKNNTRMLTMNHWIISPKELFWLVNQQGQAEYLLYRWAYDQEDFDKIYILNLKTKKMALLAKGRWLYKLSPKQSPHSTNDPPQPPNRNLPKKRP